MIEEASLNGVGMRRWSPTLSRSSNHFTTKPPRSTPKNSHEKVFQWHDSEPPSEDSDCNPGTVRNGPLESLCIHCTQCQKCPRMLPPKLYFKTKLHTNFPVKVIPLVCNCDFDSAAMELLSTQFVEVSSRQATDTERATNLNFLLQ